MASKVDRRGKHETAGLVVVDATQAGGGAGGEGGEEGQKEDEMGQEGEGVEKGQRES